ncbi:MAG: hypothetical protein ACOCYA_04885, partial [Spirochaetota bacterium]
MQYKRHFSFLTTLALVIGVYLLILGILGLLGHDSPAGEITRFFSELTGDKSQTANLVFSILLLPAGLIVFVYPFTRERARLFQGLLLFVIALWTIRIVYVRFFLAFSGNVDFLPWFRLLLQDLI